MPMSLSFLDFLDSREKAAALWLILILAYVWSKDHRIKSSFGGVIRAFFHPKLLLLFGSAAFYSATLALAAKQMGLWHNTAIKETVYWFVGTGLVLVGNATVANPDDPTFFRKILRRAVRLTLVVEFLVNLYVFPFLVELFLVPFVLLFIGMQVVAGSNSQYAPARKFIDAVLAMVGFSLLAFAAISALIDLDGFLTRENGEDFLIAPAFTLALIPLLYAMAWVSRREQENLRKRWLHPAGP